MLERSAPNNDAPAGTSAPCYWCKKDYEDHVRHYGCCGFDSEARTCKWPIRDEHGELREYRELTLDDMEP